MQSTLPEIDFSNADPAFGAPLIITAHLAHNIRNTPLASATLSQARRYMQSPGQGFERSQAEFLLKLLSLGAGWRDTQYDVDIAVGVGATQLFNIILRKFLRKDDRVIYGVPTYGLFADRIEENGGIAEKITLGPENNWKLTAEELDKKLTELAHDVKPVKFLFHMNPHNPTGAVITIEESKKIAEVIKKHKYGSHPDGKHPSLVVIDDIAYRGTEYKPDKRVVPLAAFPGMAECTLTLGSLSKAYGCAAYRIGYVIGNKKYIEPISEQILKDLEAAPITSFWGVQALIVHGMSAAEELEGYFASNAAEYKRRALMTHALINGFENYTNDKTKAVIKAAFNDAMQRYKGDRVEALKLFNEGIPNIRIANIPDAGYFQMLDFSGLRGRYFGNLRIDSVAQVFAIASEMQSVFFLPEETMRDDGKRMLGRISFALYPEEIIEGLVRIRRIAKAITKEPRDNDRVMAELRGYEVGR